MSDVEDVLKRELDQLTVQHRVLRLDRDGLYKRFVKLEEEVGQLRKAETAADAEIERMRAENEALNEAAINDASELERMQETIDSYKTENAELRRHAERLLGDAKQLDWFRRREERLDRRRYTDSWLEEILTEDAEQFPKPGAGT